MAQSKKEPTKKTAAKNGKSSQKEVIKPVIEQFGPKMMKKK